MARHGQCEQLEVEDWTYKLENYIRQHAVHPGVDTAGEFEQVAYAASRLERKATFWW